MDDARQWLTSKKGDIGEESLALLEMIGVPVAKSHVATNEEEAVKEASRMGFPLVMKIVSKDALHKSDVGGVIVGVENKEEVQQGFRKIRSNLKQHKPDADFGGVRLQQMAGPGHDLFIGGKKDDSFGPVVLYGLGGIFIELFKDSGNSLCPASPLEIRERFERLKAASILKSIRGEAPGDIESFVDAVVRVSHLLAAFPEITELDINPLRVFPQGVMALDARLRKGC
jgi:succinyl-CoA synthetase beta subunit